MADEKKVRSVNFSSFDKEFLCELAKEYPILLSASKDNKTKKEKETAWQSITYKFNAEESISTSRTSPALATCYFNLVQKAKKDYANNSREIRKTGGGPGPADVSQTTVLIHETAPQIFQSIDGVPDDDDKENENTTIESISQPSKRSRSPPGTSASKTKKLKIQAEQIGKDGEALCEYRRRHALIEHNAKMSMLEVETQYRSEEHNLRMDILRKISESVNSDNAVSLAFASI